jgi:hypothetical protein
MDRFNPSARSIDQAAAARRRHKRPRQSRHPAQSPLDAFSPTPTESELAADLKVLLLLGLLTLARDEDGELRVAPTDPEEDLG